MSCGIVRQGIRSRNGLIYIVNTIFFILYNVTYKRMCKMNARLIAVSGVSIGSFVDYNGSVVQFQIGQ